MKITPIIRSTALSALVVVAGVSAISCSKKEDAGSVAEQVVGALDASPVRNHSVLSYLPSASLGFYLLDYSLDSAKKFAATPWSGKDFSLSQSIKEMVGQSEEKVPGLDILTELETQGLIPAPASNGKIQQVLASFSIEKEANGEPVPAAVMYEVFAGGQDVAAPIPGIKTRLEAKGLKTSPVAVEGGQGFSVAVTFDPAAAVVKADDSDGDDKAAKKVKQKPITLNWTVAAKGSNLILASSPSLVNKEFLAGQPSVNTRFAELKNDAEFQRATTSLPATKSEFSWGYFDIQKLITLAAALSPDAKDSQEVLNKIPLRAAIISRDMDGSLTDRGAVTLSNDPKQSLGGLDELSQSSPSSFAAQLPSQLVGFLSLDGALIRGIGKSALDASPPDKKAEIEGVYEQIKNISEIGLAVRPQQGASPMPEVALLVNSPDAASMIETASMMISLGAGSQGFLPPFQTKEVEGVKVQYALSPFGVGVFMGASGNQAIVSTSEGILKDIISKKKGSALDSLSSDSKSLLSKSDSLIQMHVDYNQVAQLVDSLSASLGIFTGGQPLVEASVLDKLKKYGQSTASIAFANRVLQLVSRTEPTAPAAS